MVQERNFQLIFKVKPPFNKTLCNCIPLVYKFFYIIFLRYVFPPSNPLTPPLAFLPKENTDILRTIAVALIYDKISPVLISTNIISIVSRLPNLGGLCRTCEILGVGKMTIPSAAAVKVQNILFPVWL